MNNLGSVYGARGGVQEGVGGWFGDQSALVVESFIKLIGMWLLNVVEGVGVGIRTNTVPVEYGLLVFFFSAVIRILLAVRVDKFFERKKGMCWQALGHSLGCDVERPMWLRLTAFIGSDLVLRTVLVDTMKNCVEVHLSDVINRRKVNVHLYTGMFVLFTLIGSVMPYLSELSVCITGAISVALNTTCRPRSAFVKYSWVPLAALCSGFMPVPAVIGYFTVCALTEQKTGAVALVLKREQLPKLAAAILGEVPIPGLDLNRLRFVVDKHESNTPDMTRVKEYAYVGDRFLKMELSFEVLGSENLTREQASQIEQTHQNNATLAAFARYVYPEFEDEYPVYMHGSYSATLVEAVVGVAVLAMRKDPRTSALLYNSIDTRIVEMKSRGVELLTPVSSQTSLSTKS